jgi:hypothetical protein
MSEEEKDLLCSLVWQRDAAELLEHLVGTRYSDTEPYWPEIVMLSRFFSGHLTWHASFLDVQHRPRHVFLFSGGYESNEGTIVLTDGNHRLIQWQEVSVGGSFKSAALRRRSGAVEFSVIADTVAWPSPFAPRGTHRFLLNDSGITSCPVEWNEVSHGDSKRKTSAP